MWKLKYDIDMDILEVLISIDQLQYYFTWKKTMWLECLLYTDIKCLVLLTLFIYVDQQLYKVEGTAQPYSSDVEHWIKSVYDDNITCIR